VIRMIKSRTVRQVGNLNCRDSKEHPFLRGWWIEQDRQCTYKVQLRRVNVTVVLDDWLTVHHSITFLSLT